MLIEFDHSPPGSAALSAADVDPLAPAPADLAALPADNAPPAPADLSNGGGGGGISAPVITGQPENASVASGDNASFTVVATGSGLSYQWKKNGTNLGGATSATLSLSSVTDSNEGTYTCTVTNGGGSVTSDGATLTVETAPSITSQPADRTIASGADTTFTVTAAGDATLAYQWQKKPSGGSFADIDGATSATLALTSVPPEDDGAQYRCVVTNGYGSATSYAATLTLTGFTVGSLPDLIGWYKADALSLSDNDPVPLWADASGNENDAVQAVESQQPTFKTGILNGLPVVRFDGVDDLLGIAGMASGGEASSVFIVVKTRASNGFDGIFVGNKVEIADMDFSGDKHWSAFADALPDSGESLADAFRIVAAVFANFDDILMQTDGRTPVLDTTQGGYQDRPGAAIGADPTNVFAATVDIAELIIVGRAVTSTERGDINTYLASKYGITLG